MQWYTYAVTPIDLGWEYLPSVEDAASSIARLQAARAIDTDVPQGIRLEEFLTSLEDAKDAAKRAGWEDDFQSNDTTPRVCWLPNPIEFCFMYAFVWKQSNNGTTFVVSPAPLSWLDLMTA